MNDPEINKKVIDFINNKFKDASIYELNDELAKFNNKIETNTNILNSLIPQNFSNFFKCKSLLEKIKENFIIKNLQKDKLLDDHLNYLKSKFQNIIDITKLNLNKNEDEEKLKFQKKYSKLINLKQNLRANVFDYEEFYNILKESKDLFKEVENSEIFKNLMTEIEPEIKDCIDNIYCKIIDSDTVYEECCILSEYYFLISDTKIGSNESNITNTLLVNFKQTTYFRKSQSDKFYVYLNSSLFKLIKYMNDDQLSDAIRHYFKCIEEVLSNSNCHYFKTLVLRIKDFQKSLKIFPNCLRIFKKDFSEFKIKNFENFIKKVEFKKIPEIFNIFLTILKLDEVHKIQEIIFKKTEDYLHNNKVSIMEYLNTEIEEINIIKPCLGSEDNYLCKKLENVVRDKRNKAILEVSDKFKIIFDIYDDYGILMKCLKLTVDLPKYCSNVFVECKEEIYKRPIVLYFLHKFLGIKIPVLSKDEILKINEMKKQFDCLIEN